MSILTWIEEKKRLKLLNAPKYVNPTSDSSKGLWTRCDKCGVILYIKHLKENQRVCFGCTYHLQMSSQERIGNLLDKESWRPFDETVSPCDPLEFHDQKDYTDRLRDAQDKTGLQDAIQTGTGLVDGIPVALGIMDFDFMGGSMGSVVGEKITRLIEYATQEGLTLLLVCASGGARMQEGVFSLMQMAKISSALQIYQSCANLLYISILTSPTTGGVTASFAMLGDIIFAEPKALIAFAGRRVIEQTLCEDLPENFQTSEYMLHHGLVDLIVPRRFLRQALSESIKLYKNAPFKKPGRIPFGVQNPISFLTEEKLRRQWDTLSKNTSPNSEITIDSINITKVADAPTFGKQFTKGADNAFLLTETRDDDSESIVKQNSDEFLDEVSTIEQEDRVRKNLSNAPLNAINETNDSQDDEILKNNLNLENFAHQDTERLPEQTAPYLSDLTLRETKSGFAKQNSEIDVAGGVNTNKSTATKMYPRDFETRSSAILSSKDNSTISPEHTISRNSLRYREILTSFQMMYQLFSKQMTISSTNDKTPILSNNLQDKSRPDAVSVGDQNLIEASTSGVASPRKIVSLHSEPGSAEVDANSSKAVSLLQKFRELAEGVTQVALQEENSYRGEALQDSNNFSTWSNDTLQTSLSSKENGDFLNQALELAATESIEWRAFYVHQTISKRTGFLEDFLSPSHHTGLSASTHKVSIAPAKLQNTLFYKSICRTFTKP